MQRARSAAAVLPVSLLFLTLCAAGGFARATALTAALLSGTWLFVAVRAAHTPHDRARRHVETVYLAILAAFLVWLTPLPHAGTRLTGSRRYAQNTAALQALTQGRELGLWTARSHGFALTRNRAGSLRMAALTIAAFSAGLLAATLEPRRRRRLLSMLAAIGAILAAAATVSLRVYPQGDTIWWVVPIAHDLPGPVACFVNRNHLAGYLALLAPAALALAVESAERRRPAAAAVYAAALALMGLAVCLIDSRGGLIAFGIALLAAALLLILYRRRLAGAVVLALLVGALAAFAALPAAAPQRARFARLLNAGTRGSVYVRATAWRDTLSVWRAYPLWGAGPEGFRMVYPQHRRTSAGASMSHAENEYVQLLADAGLAGVALAGALLLALRRGLRLRPPPTGPADCAVGVATGGALAAALVHAGFEFLPHIPLVSVTLAILIGLAWTPGPAAPGAARPATGRLAAAAAFAGALALVLLPAAWLRADSATRLEHAPPEAVARSLRSAPTSWRAWYALGRAAYAARTPAARAFGDTCVDRAVALDPNNYKLWREVGRFRLSIGDTAGARRAYEAAHALRSWIRIPPALTRTNGPPSRLKPET
ncbi:MAG: O-antigen ligase family protein [Lentisphaerae bacterium]|nr:O-antigen ligase family protein [Lentisphaerota bacterium]